MTLPELPFKIPEIPLPFDIPALMHPPVAHFIIAIPVIVLLLEIVNLIVKKRAIGVTAFFLLTLAVVAAVAAYLTGGVDGKAAWDLLTQDGQTAVKAHKLFGTYLLLASVIVLLFKLLSSMIQRGLMKGLYLLVLIIFVVGILKQGKEGGELVYTYGANVKIVKTMDTELFDCKDDLSDYVAEEKEAEEEAKAAEEEKAAEEATKAEAAKVEVAAKSEEAPKAEEKAETTEAAKEEAPAVEAEAPAIESESAATETPAAETPAVEAEAPEVEKVETPSEPTPEIATH